ncbi:MAG: DUF368 domain-containing protein [Flavobacteriaceae bacterium]|nr:DUF368 domain-containing protein [Flavobacteriaceae bacterium]
MRKERTLSDNVFLVIKGLAMGAANKVPGVSGGIVAFVVGFYEEFIYSLQKINKKAFMLLLAGRFKSFFAYTNAKFLGLLVLGMLISYFSVSRILDYFLKKHEVFVWAIFFGLIVGSIYYIYKDFEQWTKSSTAFALFGLLVGISISFLSPATENNNLMFVFLCGIISVSGMAFPGLSGSFILMLLGNYVLLLVDAVNALYDTVTEVFAGNYSFVDNTNRLQMLKILGVFTLGSTVGMVSLSHFLSFMLKRYKEQTTAIILGFVIGSLGVVWPWKVTHYKLKSDGGFLLDSNGNKIIVNYERYLPDFNTVHTWYAIGFAILGVLVVIGLEQYGKYRTRS